MKLCYHFDLKMSNFGPIWTVSLILLLSLFSLLQKYFKKSQQVWYNFWSHLLTHLKLWATITKKVCFPQQNCELFDESVPFFENDKNVRQRLGLVLLLFQSDYLQTRQLIPRTIMEPTYLVFLLCSIFVGATKEPGKFSQNSPFVQKWMVHRHIPTFKGLRCILLHQNVFSYIKMYSIKINVYSS